MQPRDTLSGLAGKLESGATTSRHLVEQFLEKLAAKPAQAQKCFVLVDQAGARAAADLQDQLRKAGKHAGPYAGIPFSVKDLFDIEGQVTRAGSRVLSQDRPAQQDAVAISALKRAGLVVVGRTNMTEFAYSGLGLNPHYETPLCIYDQQTGRAPGGSSAGAGVSVAEGFNVLSIGTDTGGSCRIPAAYNGIVGFKPSASRVSTKGAYPLSSSFDSIGPLAGTVKCCAIADGIMAGDVVRTALPHQSRPLRIGVLQNPYVMGGLQPEVSEDFERALFKLKASGAHVEDVMLDGLDDLSDNLKRGGIVGFEAFQHHNMMLETSATLYDPRVASRIQAAGQIRLAEYHQILDNRHALIFKFESMMDGFDAVVCPTVANISPKLVELATDEDYARLNGVALRNTYVANFLDGCSISLPMHVAGHAPTGLMLTSKNGQDEALLTAAAHIFEILEH